MIKGILQNYIKTIQKILITVLLTFVYFIGFGVTLILVIIFNRKILGKKYKDRDTFWKEAEGYQDDMGNSIRQS